MPMLPNAAASVQTPALCLVHAHTYHSGELTYEPSNYEHAVLTFPKANSITQAFGDSAVSVSSDQSDLT